MFGAWLLLAGCDAGTSTEVEPAAASVYLPEMWLQRALTVRAGIEECTALLEAGRGEEAAEMIGRVRAGSFEPELAPLIRRELGPAAVTEIQYRFGQAAQAARRGDVAAWRRATGGLLEALDRAARSLDARRAVLEGP